MSSLPDHFHFSQSSLQDYVDCRRRFKLRYLMQLSWPAIITEPIREHEKWVQRGERFHHLVEQFFTGIPPQNLEEIARDAGDTELQAWWSTFLKVIPPLIRGSLFIEKTFSLPVQEFRLGAKYDLVVFDPAKGITIFDWKTSLRPLRRSNQLHKMQSRVYPYVMVTAGREITGSPPIRPDQIEMVYWNPAFPESIIQIQYHQDQYQKDHRYINGLINEIISLSDDQFPLTDQVKQCQFCVYRSLCDRGVRAGQLNDSSADEEWQNESLDFDFDQVEEMMY